MCLGATHSGVAPHVYSSHWTNKPKRSCHRSNRPCGARAAEPVPEPSEPCYCAAKRNYFQSDPEHKQHALAPTPRKSGFSSASDRAPSQHNGYKSAYRTTVYRAGFVVGERRGHVARLVGAARKWKRDWNRRRDDFSNTRLLKRLPTRGQLGCVLIHLRYRAPWCAKGVRPPDATRHQTGQCPLWVKADIALGPDDVRFTPESGHRVVTGRCGEASPSRQRITYLCLMTYFQTSGAK
jgi:hypothetical protein